MPRRTIFRLALLAAPAWLVVAPTASAEHLVFVSGDRLSARDSGNLSIELDSISYALPNAYGAVSADFDPDDDRFYVLGRSNEGTCGVFFVDIEHAPELGAEGTTPVSTNIAPTACTGQVSDIEFIRSSGFDAGLLVADGPEVLSYDSDSKGWDRIAVSDGNANPPRVLALGLRGIQGADASEAVIGNGDGRATLSDLRGGEQGVSLSNPRTLVEVMGQISSDASVTLPVAYDLSEATGHRYLLAGGQVFSVDVSGKVVSLGQAPAGTIAMAVAREDGGNYTDIDEINDSGTGTKLRLTTSQGSFENPRSTTQPPGAPDSVTYPYGWVAFKVKDLAPGQTVQVTLTPSGEGPVPDRYIKCAPAPDCSVFDGATFTGRTVTLTLTDGGKGDADKLVNGVIDDPGALAVAKTPPVSTPWRDEKGGALPPLSALMLLLALSLRLASTQRPNLRRMH